MPQSLYIHIPFCKKKCLYCDFYSVAHESAIVKTYVSALASQINQINSSFSTIYIGGGTPTILDENLLEKLLSSLNNKIKKDTEFTVEANPESLTPQKIDLFLRYKVNRLSIGVQSLDDEKLKKLGRLHDVKTALTAIRNAKNSGFKNISIDLIFGLWDEKLDDWKEELKKAVSLPIKHLSCYALSYEKKTPLYKKIKNKEIVPLGDILAAKMFKYAIDYLPPKGFLHYEVSNFSKRDYECRHNLNYWQNNEYIGIGSGAVSYVNGERTKNIGTKIFREKLSAEKKAKETAALKIRTKEGIDFAWFKEKTGFDVKELVGDSLGYLLKNNLIRINNKKVRLTKKGFLFCDTVSSSFL